MAAIGPPTMTEPAASMRRAAADGARGSVRVSRKDLHRLRTLAHSLSNALAPLLGSVDMLAAKPSDALSPEQRAIVGAALDRADDVQAQLAELKLILRALD